MLLAGVLSGCGGEEAGDVEAPRGSGVDAAAAGEVIAELVQALQEPGPASEPRWPAYFDVNADAVGLGEVSMRYLVDDAAQTASLPEGQWAGVVDLSWSIDQADPAPAHAEVSVIFSGSGDELRIAGVGGGGRVAPLWLQEPVEVARGTASMAIVAGERSAERAARYVRLADQGVRAVGEVLRPRRQGVVIEAPASVEQLDTVLGTEPGSHSGIAAVTTPIDGSTAPGAPTHVFLNPAQFAGLAPRGAQVVITHEITHVVTEAATAVGVPLWLTEGFADYVALRDSTVPVTEAASQILAQVRKRGAPRSLPSDAEFAVRTDKLGASYEAAWLACTVLVDEGGEAALLRFHRVVMAGDPVDQALDDVFGLDEARLIALWRARLVELAG